MAFSMFLRKQGLYIPVCTSRVFSQHVMRQGTQPVFTHKAASTAVPVRTMVLKNSTPIMNAVRSFRTSIVRQSQSVEKGHDHSKLWVVEKAVSAALVPLIPIALLIPNKITDSLLAILITAHTFWGLDAIVVEYIRVLLFGPLIPKLAKAVVYAITVVILGGLFYLNFNDIGITRAFWRIWKNMRKPKLPPPPPRSAHKKKKGFEAIAVDYVRASIFGPVIPKIAIGLVWALSIATLGGLFYIISHDIGLANTVRQIWSIKSEEKA